MASKAASARLTRAVGGVLDQKLDALAPLPHASAQMPRDMQRLPLAAEKELAERRVGDAEGASLEPRAVGRSERAAEMRVFDDADAGQPVRRKDEARLGVSGPVRARRGRADPSARCSRRRPRARRRWRARATGPLAPPAPRAARAGSATSRSCLGALELETRRHGVAAAFDEKPFMHGAPHRGAEIDRGDRAGRARGEAVRLERRDERWQPEALGDAARDKTEQALVPALGGKKEQRQAGICGERRHPRRRKPPPACAPRSPSARR